MWSAPPADESQEDKMKVERMVLGQIQTNCYFAINEATKETIVIDPADRPDSVLRKAVDEGLTLKAIFLTHGHVFNEKNLPMLGKGDILLHGHTHVPVCREHETYTYLNPGSVSIPKEESAHSYMTYEDGLFQWKDLDGQVYMEYRI